MSWLFTLIFLWCFLFILLSALVFLSEIKVSNNTVYISTFLLAALITNPFLTKLEQAANNRYKQVTERCESFSKDLNVPTKYNEHLGCLRLEKDGTWDLVIRRGTR